MLTAFTDIDRQTELSDDDGTLTGLRAKPAGLPLRDTISVNEDDFFNAPVETPECASDAHLGGEPATEVPATAKTSPYEYVTTAMLADCAIGATGTVLNTCSTPEMTEACKTGDTRSCNGNWGQSCTTADPNNSPCYGVPLYRELVTSAEGLTARPVVRMMGQASGQRSTMTVNHGRYLVDTTTTRSDEQTSFGNPLFINPSVFLGGHTYYFFLVYGTSTTQQTYDIFVGTGAKEADVLAGVKPVRVNINDNNFGFPAPAEGAMPFVKAQGYSSTTGILTVSIDLTGYGSEFTSDKHNFCEPPTYCSWNKETSQCGCLTGSNCTDGAVCAWAVKDIDCPTLGCFGFGVTFPAGFSAGKVANFPPSTQFQIFPGAAVTPNPWTVPFSVVSSEKSGAQCNYPSPPQ